MYKTNLQRTKPRFTKWGNNIKLTTVCSTVKEVPTIFPSGAAQKNSERTNRRSKIVAATVANDVVEDNNTQETYMICKEVRLINPEEPEKTTNALVFFDTGSDCNYITESMGKKKNIQAYVVDSILERVPYLINHDSEKLAEGRWGKPDVLLGVEGIADLVIRNPTKHPPGWVVIETELGMIKGGRQKMVQDEETETTNLMNFKPLQTCQRRSRNIIWIR
uniref:DUF1758 domain-containing protein n=1 Tax=Wuchereria bancrofti TaxID=6293 RepID=A0AAF5PVU8_WUCBA